LRFLLCEPNDFVEIEVTDRVFEIEKENMEKLCRKLNSK
jgi:DNA-binding Xre family transcriptional regulator